MDSVKTFGFATASAMTIALAACGGGTTANAPLPTVQSQSVARSMGATSGGLVYVSNGTSIDIYEQAGNNQSPIGTLATGLDRPSGMTVTTSGDLYVTNAANSTIAVFHRGATSPFETLTGLDDGGGGYRNDVTTAPDGTVYAVNGQTKKVYVYSHGATAPTSTLTTTGKAQEVATDSKGNVFVELLNGGPIEEFPVGKKTPKKLAVSVYDAGGIAFDGSDNLVACVLGGQDGFGGDISTYAAPYNGKPILQTGLFDGIYGCAVNRTTGNIWAATGGNSSFLEEFNLALKEKDLLPITGFASGVAVESQ